MKSRLVWIASRRKRGRDLLGSEERKDAFEVLSAPL